MKRRFSLCISVLLCIGAYAGSGLTIYKNFSKIVNTFYNEEIENISEEEIDIKSKGTK